VKLSSYEALHYAVFLILPPRSTYSVTMFGSGTHPASYQMGAACFFPGGKASGT